jgi:hypothetical protein
VTVDEQQWATTGERCITWAVAVHEQLDRIALDRAGMNRVRVATDVDGPTKQPFALGSADVHFLLIACNNLQLNLRDFEEIDERAAPLRARLPQLEIWRLRDVLEHPKGDRSVPRFAEDFPDKEPHAHGWRSDGTGLIGEILDDATLRTAVADVRAGLRIILSGPVPR